MGDVRPIGVFDSGVGGLSILAEIHRALPSESVVFVADQGWAPYGDRSLPDLEQRSFAVVDHLLAAGAKSIVVACNTASAAALRSLRERHPDLRFVGMEPAMKPAAEQSDRKVVGVLATTATFQGELYASVVDRHTNGVRVLAQPAPGLVDLIEQGELDGPRLDALLERYLVPMIDAGIDTLVLGCTHYPFIGDRIRVLLGDDVRLIDPAPAVARQVGRILAIEGLEAGPGVRGVTTFLTTGDAARFGRQVRELIALQVDARTVEI